MSSSKNSFIDFSKYAEGVDSQISKIDYSSLPKLGDKDLKSAKKDILKLINKKDNAKDLLTNPPEQLEEFLKIIRQTFNSDSSLYTNLFDSFSPCISEEKKECKNLALYIVSLIHDAEKPRVALEFFSHGSVLPGWHKFSSRKNSILKGVSVVELKEKDKKYWAYVDTDKYLRVDEISDDKRIRNINNMKVSTLKRGSSGIKFKGDDNVTITVKMEKPELADVWKDMTKTPLPLFFSTYMAPVPKAVLAAAYETVCSDDSLLLNILTDPAIVNVKDNIKFMGDLYDIACYSGRVNQLFVTVASHEFSSEELTATSVLRSNTHLTNLFKIVFQKSGDKYFKNFIAKIVDYALKYGDIGLEKLDKCKSDKAEELLFTSLKYIIKSSPLIQGPIRHLAAVLKNQAICRFNDKDAVLNTLSGFFLLRFVTAAIADPKTFGYPGDINEEQTIHILAPFAALLQKPLSFAPIEGDAKFIKTWNQRIEVHIAPKLKNFIHSIPDMETDPIYLPPEGKKVKRALDHVLSAVCNSFPNFSQKYNKLLENEGAYTPLGWAFSAFYAGFFTQNI